MIKLAIFNGSHTIQNRQTGEHRTFRVYTAQHGKLKGKRISVFLEQKYLDNMAHTRYNWDKGEQWMKAYDKPKSRCSCGHSGDGLSSQHGPMITQATGHVIEDGHGGCLVDGCNCQQFTWEDFLPAYLEWRKQNA